MSEEKYSIVAEEISKCYKMYNGSKQKLFDLLLPNGAGKEFYALKDISFKVKKGEVVGLIGLNGSGKSTLSNILGGVSMPTKGKITIEGESALIAIGLGLNNFLTGMENIEIKCIMMGYKKEEIEKITQEIIDFADIGDFITQPIRTYSSGMRSRLGFAISVYTNPDILVIDEALSVGDPTFTQKCLDKMNEFKDKGKTIFFVSHSTSQVRQFCTKALWLEYGCLKDFGSVEDILPKYNEYIKFVNSMTEHEKKVYKKIVLNHQEHALLSDFKILDPKYKKLNPKGKFIKHVQLINKLGEIIIIPYMFDYATAVLGFIPSLFRRRIIDSVMILVAQIANLFIIPQPFNLVTNFIITIIIGLFTGKIYTTYLMEKKGYLDYSVWKVNYMEDKLKEEKIKKSELDINKKNKISKVMMLAALVSIIIVPTVSYTYQRNYLNSIEVINQQKEVLEGNIAIIILETNNEGKQIVNGVSVLSQDKESSKLKAVFYPGDLQVKYNDNYDEIKNIVDIKNIEVTKELFKANFGFDLNNYLTIDSKTYELDTQKENYQFDVIKDFLNSDERGVNGKKAKILKGKTNLKEENLVSFYNKFKGVKEIIGEVIVYKEVVLSTVIDENKLSLIDKLNQKDLKIKIVDETQINDVKLIKDLIREYDEKVIEQQS